nr:hypothetical protein GCM10023233_03120 [Brevibacterium otitidis]
MGMDNLAALELVFSGLVVLAALGTAGVGLKVITNLFKTNR